jgi:hypothetical protein
MKLKILILALIVFSNIGCMYLREGAILEHDRKVNQKILDTRYADMDQRKKELILNRKYEIGFTKDEVKMAMGSLISPTKIKKSAEYGADEVWIYETSMCGANNVYLYFKSDVLIKKEVKEHICQTNTDKVKDFFSIPK